MTENPLFEVARGLHRIADALFKIEEGLNDRQWGEALEGLASLKLGSDREVAVAIHAVADAIETKK